MSEPGAVALPDPRDADASAALSFPDLPRLELDELLTQLVDRAQEVLRTQGRLRGLLRANQLVSSDLTSSAVLHRTVRAARDLVGARYAAVEVVGPDGELSEVASAGQRPAEAGAARLDEPLRVRDDVLGRLHLVGGTDGSFSAEDRELVRALASTAAISVQNARFHESARRRERWLQASAAITEQLLAAEDARGARPLDAVARSIRDVAGADLVAIVRPAEEDDPATLRIDTVLGVAGSGADVPAGQLVRDGSLAGRVLATGRPVCVPDAATTTDLGSLPWAGVPVGPVMAVPLTGPRTVHGVLCAARLRGRPAFSSDDLEMAGGFAGQAAVAVELADARAERGRAAMLDERDRIAADLHDTVVQRLFSAGMSLQGALAGLGPGRATARVQSTVAEIDATINQIRATVFRLGSAAPAPGAALGDRVLDVVTDLASALGFEPGLRLSGRLPDSLPVGLVDDVCAVLTDLLSELAESGRVPAVEVEVTVGHDGLAVDVRYDDLDVDAADGPRCLPELARRAERYGGSLTRSPLGGSWSYLSWSVPWPGGAVHEGIPAPG